MATSTSPAPAQQRPRQNRDSGPGVNFGRVLKSEWIKVTTVPSTVILIVSTVVVMVGLAALASWAISITQDEIQSAGAPPGGPGGPGMEGFDAAEQAWMIPSSGLIFGQLLIASLAVVLIASEWATGMIRSTMVAVPKRMPALLAKNAIIAVIAFVIGAGSAFLSYLVAQPILGGDLDFGLATDGVLPSIVNTGTYLAFIAIISMAIGTLLRNTAGGVVTAVALFFVVPLIIVNLLSGLADWIPDAARFLPTNAGDQLVAITTESDALTQWEGGLVMGAWALVLLVVSLVVTQKRDV